MAMRCYELCFDWSCWFRPNRLVDGVCLLAASLPGIFTTPDGSDGCDWFCQGPDGHLKKTNRYRLSLTCNGLDLRAFPFDTQILPIRLKAGAVPDEDLVTSY